jgi:RNA polymerase sigma-70 factor, ECF subfamily
MRSAQLARSTQPRLESRYQAQRLNQGSSICGDYETALVECAAGDTAAIASLYTNEYCALRNAARRIVRDRADDVVHDAFVQILRDSKDFDPARGSARAWIFAIVRNTAFKKLRSESKEVPVDDATLLSIYDSELQLEQPERALDYDGLKSCLEELEPKRRASLILAIVDGRTHSEIAALLRVPVGTVKSWIRRELMALRERLK